MSGKLKLIPEVNFQPFIGTGLSPVLCNSMNSSPGSFEVELYIISLITMVFSGPPTSNSTRAMLES